MVNMTQIGIQHMLLRTSVFQLQREAGMQEDRAMHSGGVCVGKTEARESSKREARAARQRQDIGKT